MKESIIIRAESQRTYALDILRDLPLDEPHEVKVKPWKKSRSQAQNSYLWGVVYERIRWHLAESGITDDVIDAEDLHDWLASKFLPKRVVMLEGEPIIGRGRTSTLNTQEFGEYLEHVIRWAAERGIFVPPPMEGA